MIGQVVGQYRFVEKLGEGGMGAVYKGIDLMVERDVAIKMLRPDIAHQPELVERFRAEAIVLAKLNSPGIATLYNFFRYGEDYFMVMEFLAGQTLEQTLHQGGPMPWERGVPLFCQILESIAPAHRAGVLHRDIKPANIMLTDQGLVKVMDFGIARVLGSARVTRVGRVIGTMEYVPPERIQGSEADIRADIYSLGVVLYEMLSAHLPFENMSEFEMMRRHIQAEPPPLSTYSVTVPEGIERVIQKALAKRPRDRFATCPEMEAALWSAMEEAGWRRPSAASSNPIRWSGETSALPGDGDAAATVPLSAGRYGGARSHDSAQDTLPADRTAGVTGAGRAAGNEAPTGPSADANGSKAAPASFLDRLTGMHYAGATVLALALGGGTMILFHGLSSTGPQPVPAVQTPSRPEDVARPPARRPEVPAPQVDAGASPVSGAVRASGPAGAPAAGTVDAKPSETASGAPAQSGAAQPGPAGAFAPGVYVKQGAAWKELLEESVSWKKGSSVKRFTVGFGKEEFVGSIPGAASPNHFGVPITFRVSGTENAGADRYALVLLHPKGDLREVKVSGSGSSSKNLVHFEATQAGTRIWDIQFSQGAGEYGFLPPAPDGGPPISTRMYTFRVDR